MLGFVDLWLYRIGSSEMRILITPVICVYIWYICVSITPSAYIDNSTFSENHLWSTRIMMTSSHNTESISTSSGYIRSPNVMIPTVVCWLAQITLQWRHNERDGVSNHQPHDCLLNRLFRCKSKKTPKVSVTGLCVGNSPVTGDFTAQRASIAENVSIWWRHHGIRCGGRAHVRFCCNSLSRVKATLPIPLYNLC